MTAPILSARGLRKEFPLRGGGVQVAVAEASFDLLPGRALALVEESGSGKSTLGMMALGLLPPTAGEVLYRGSPLPHAGSGRLRLRRELQVVFQDPHSSLNPRHTVRRIVTEGMVIHRIGAGPREREGLAAELLRKVALGPDCLDRYPADFSGGQRQRIAIARALSVGPKVLVLDEPTSALDVSVQSQLLDLLRRLQQEEGLSYLFITHNLAVVEYLADEVAVMEQGRIVEQGPTAQIFDAPQHPYTRRLLASLPSLDPLQPRLGLRQPDGAGR